MTVAPVAPVVQPPTTAPVTPPSPEPVTYGYYDCSALEDLWVSEGGNPSEAFIAAEIATAESGGNPNAVSPTDDFGLWQVNGSWGSAMASLNPMVNARSAIAISHDGTDWYPWTTYTSGAYEGRC